MMQQPLLPNLNQFIDEPQGSTTLTAPKSGNTFSVRLPDGTIVENVPEGTTKEQLRAKLEPQGFKFDSAPEPQGKNFAARMQEDFTKRKQQLGATINRAQNFQQTPMSTGLQVAGTLAGGLNDIAGEVLPPVDSAIRDIFVPQAVQNIAGDAARSAGSAIADSSLGKAVGNLGGQVGTQYGKFEKSNPVQSADINSAVNLLGILPVAKTGVAAKEATNIIGDSLIAGADSRILKRDLGYAKDLVMPDLTKSQAIKAGEVDRTVKQGLLGKYQVKPDAQQALAIQNVAEIPGVKKGNTFLENYQAIDTQLGKQSDELISNIKANDVPISDDTVLNAFQGVRDNLAKNPYISGVDGSKAANAVIDNAIDIVLKNPRTASGMLQARKDLDALVRSQKGAKAFDPALEAPITNAVQQIRQTMNGLVAEAVPSANVRQSLAKQSSYFTALDNIEPKVLKENPTRLGRAAEKLTSALPGESAGAKAAYGLAAAGGLGTAAVSGALPALGGAAALYQAGKLATSPKLQKIVGKLLGGSKMTVKDIKELPKQQQVQVIQAVAKNPEITSEDIANILTNNYNEAQLPELPTLQ